MKNKSLRIIVVFLILIMLSGLACAESHITVTGTASIMVPADSAMISMGVITNDENASSALANANSVIHDLREAITELGIDSSSITTDNLFLYTNESMDSTEVSYNVHETLNIYIADLEIAGEVIDTALANGANTINDITFMASDTSGASDTMSASAFENAKHRGEILAAAAGGKLGKVISISTEAGSVYGTVNSAKMQETAASDATVLTSAGIEVSSVVTVVFELDELE